MTGLLENVFYRFLKLISVIHKLLLNIFSSDLKLFPVQCPVYGGVHIELLVHWSTIDQCPVYGGLHIELLVHWSTIDQCPVSSGLHIELWNVSHSRNKCQVILMYKLVPPGRD